MTTAAIEDYFESKTVTEDGFLTNATVTDATAGTSGITITFTEVLKIIVGFVGMVGNFTVCLAVSQMKSKEVKFLIGSQAAIDALTSFVLVAGTLSSRWLFTQLVSPESYIAGYFYCMFWHWDGLLFYLFSMSTYNLMAISIERYMAVIHPIWYRTNFTRGRAIILGAIFWLIAPFMQLVICIGQTFYIDGYCQWINFKPIGTAVAGVFLFIWDFFGPCMIMGICFAKIILKLREQDERAKDLQGSLKISTVSVKSVSLSVKSVSIKFKEEGVENGKQAAKASAASTSRSRNVTKTFLTVFVAFILCWITNQVLYLQQNLGGYDYHGNPENHFANTMAILNSAINPFIYVFRFQQYRNKMKAMFCITCTKSNV